MQKIWTLGSNNRRTQFTYSGSVDTGVTLHFTGTPQISSALFRAILTRFKGKTLAGGFSMTDPTPGGLGQWIAENSKRLNSVKLNPRHGSFIAAVLVHEGFITSSLKGNAIYLHFK
jgi:hypothetical protein